MLTRLSIRHFAIVDEVDLEFQPNLSVITGETGAGKSIIIDALALLLGKPASDTLIKIGFNDAWVEATFIINDTSKYPHLLMYQDSDSPNLFTFFRQISRHKTNYARINGQTIPLKILKKSLSPLLYIVSQHQSVSILDPTLQKQLIDDYVQLKTKPIYQQFQTSFAKYQSLKNQLENSPSGIPQLHQEREFIRFQLDDLLPHSFNNDEEDTLKALRQRHKTRNQSLKTLTVIQDKLNQTHTILTDISKSLSTFPSTVSDNVEDAIQVATSSIETPLQWCQQEHLSYSDTESININDIESRLDLLFRYKTKYHVNHTRDLVSKIHELKKRDAALTQCLDDSDQLQAQLQPLFSDCLQAAKALHDLRQKTATEFATQLVKDCLNLQFSYCDIQLNVIFDEHVLSDRGADRVEWLISTNKGLPVGPLSQVASGGELSRLMLAIESNIAAHDPNLTMVFDEVDTGVGGLTARAIGDYLSDISMHKPVICITHLPQIAQRANHHITIEKYETATSTNVKVAILSDDERPEELKRMVGGEAITTLLN